MVARKSFRPGRYYIRCLVLLASSVLRLAFCLISERLRIAWRGGGDRGAPITPRWGLGSPPAPAHPPPALALLQDID